MEPIRIIIVDDHKIIRDGLIAIFKDNPSINVIGSVASGDELLALMKRHPIDLVLLDMHMPLKNGIEVTREVKAEFPQVTVLINTMSKLPDEIDAALAAGVEGYVLKTAGSDELLKAIILVANGNSYFGQDVIKTYIKNLTAPVPGNTILTPLELKIVKLIFEEKKHEEIMDQLQMSKSMLNDYLQTMYRKLKVNSEIGLVKYVLKEKLIW